jgi:hypothetical protein
MMARDWLDDVKGYDILSAAAAFGLKISGRMFGPCPRCGREKRGSSDGRPPLGVRPDGRGFECQRCHEDAKGDVVNLAVLVASNGDAIALTKANRADVRRACAAAGLCDPDPLDRNPAPAPRPRIAPAPAVPVVQPPPEDEVARLWAACVTVTNDAGVAAWLTTRGLDPKLVADADTARALPLGLDLDPYRWASLTKDPDPAKVRASAWNARGYRCLVPLYRADGALAGVRARYIDGDPRVTRKSLAPAGTSVAGLVMADELGRRLLSGLERAAAVWIAEGEPDFLSVAQVVHGDERAPAVLGMFQGSWTDALAARIPDGCRVTIGAHNDKDGDKYAARIAASLDERARAGRVRIFRWRQA